MFCLKRIAQIFACGAVNIQIEFLAAKYLRNVLAGAGWCYTRWYHVSTHQSWYVIYNLHTNYHTRLSCPGCPVHNLYFSPLQHLDIWSQAPVILMSIVTPGVCLYCSDVSLCALFTHSCRVSPRSEGSDDGFIYTARGPAIISKIITNSQNVLHGASAVW